LKSFIEDFLHQIDKHVSLKTLKEAEEAGFLLLHPPITENSIIDFITLALLQSQVSIAYWSLSNVIGSLFINFQRH
jgi:hypothetical protein